MIETETQKFWYHKIVLPDGTITPGCSPYSVDAYSIPDDLTGKTVLDIGAWDGFWTFEALKRGAKYVLAIDDFSDTIGANINADRSPKWENFDFCADQLGYDFSRFDREEMSIYDISGKFDCVFAFGLLYHLRHPLLALELIRKVCADELCIETAILDGITSPYSGRVYQSNEVVSEFYPENQYGENYSNWHVGTLRYWASLVYAAGFKDITMWKLFENPTDVYQCRGFINAKIA